MCTMIDLKQKGISMKLDKSSEPVNKFTFSDQDEAMTLAGFKLSDIFTVGVCLVLGLAIFNQIGGLVGFAFFIIFTIIGFGLAYITLKDRKLLAWIQIFLQWTFNRKLSDKSDVGLRAIEGSIVDLNVSESDRPVRSGLNKADFNIKILKHVKICSTKRNIGVVVDRQNKKMIALMKISKGQFGLLDGNQRDGLVNNWTVVLNSLNSITDKISSIQIITHTCEYDLSEYKISLNENDLETSLKERYHAAHNYNKFLDFNSSGHFKHNSYIALSVSERKATFLKNSQIDELLEEVENEAINLGKILKANGFNVYGLCTKNAIENLFKNLIFDDPKNNSMKNIYELSIKSEWDHLKINSKFQSVYWISSWPKYEVLSDFMSPLTLNCDFSKVLSLTVCPVDFEAARREAESKLVSYVSDDELRKRAGFLNTATRQHGKSKSELLNYEIANGFETFKYSGYLSVVADSLADLKRKETALELAATKCNLNVRKLYGQQDLALGYILPLCRGVK